MRGYPLTVDGLLLLAADLTSAAVGRRRTATKALLSQPFLTDVILLVDESIQIADGNPGSGRDEPNARVLEQWRVIAAIRPRLEELQADPDAGVRKWTAAAAAAFETSRGWNRLHFRLAAVETTGIVAVGAVAAALIAYNEGSFDWYFFAVAVAVVCAVQLGLVSLRHWRRRSNAKALADTLADA